MRTQKRKGRRGNFLLLFAVAATVVLGFGALSIDISYLRNSQMELQNAVDAAAHAALLTYRDGSDDAAARAVAQQVAAANRVAGKPLTLSDDDIVFGTWDFDDRTFSTSGSFVNAVQVTGRRTESSNDGQIDYFLGGIIGTDHGEAVANATGAYRFREMMLLLDVTGSFFRDIDNGRNAVLTFLTEINSNHLPQDKIGLTTFAQVAKVVTPLQDVEGNATTIYDYWNGQGNVTSSCRTIAGRTSCTYVSPHNYGLNICFHDQAGDGTADQGAPFNQKYYDAAQTVLNINCFDGTAYPSSRTVGTYHAEGLESAIDSLLAEGLAGNMKVIILISDGRAQCDQPDTASTASCVAQRQQEAYDQVERASENNISIFSVMFCSNCDATQMASYEAFSAAMATGIGKSYTTNQSNQLDDILAEIADSLPVALVQ